MYALPLASLALSLAATSALATTTVAVVDSGIDYKHVDLASRIWASPGETADNGQDDDQNGFVDDVRGWNFAENNADVIDYKYLGTFSDDCKKFFQVQAKVLKGTATDQDKEWLKEKREDPEFIKELMKFANFVHGSHVSGIATASRSIERVIAVKIIPTETPGLNVDRILALKAQLSPPSDDPLGDVMMPILLDYLVEQQVGVINQAFDYAEAQGAQVVNGSFGVSYASASQLVKTILQMIQGADPDEADVKKHTRYLIDKMNELCKKEIDKAKESTIFVFAAANDGTDNDDVNVAPGGVKADNVVTVAATLDFESLASFSNFGAKTVDVAAPGVDIKSTIPGDDYLEMSGTSMASPYVAQIAALVKDANPALKPAEIKKIIVGTVDVKDWLKNKVSSGGVVNTQRAVEAARNSRTLPPGQAILLARTTVPDVRVTVHFAGSHEKIFAAPLPSPL